MHPPNKAQSTVQYTLVILLVATAVILAGPYVIRSINAHFKGYEDAIYDSFTDPLIKSSDMPPLGHCGDGNCCTDPNLCTPLEDISNCCLDCGSCGDNVCCGASQGGVEDQTGAGYCPEDCGTCGDGVCCQDGSTPLCDEGVDPLDPSIGCCNDCANNCGDGYCCSTSGYYKKEDIPAGGVTPVTGECPEDCNVEVCDNDFECEEGEDTLNCPHDCCLCGSQPRCDPANPTTCTADQDPPVCDTGSNCFEDLAYLDGNTPNPYSCPGDCLCEDPVTATCGSNPDPFCCAANCGDVCGPGCAENHCFNCDSPCNSFTNAGDCLNPQLAGRCKWLTYPIDPSDKCIPYTSPCGSASTGSSCRGLICHFPGEQPEDIPSCPSAQINNPPYQCDLGCEDITDPVLCCATYGYQSTVGYKNHENPGGIGPSNAVKMAIQSASEFIEENAYAGPGDGTRVQCVWRVDGSNQNGSCVPQSSAGTCTMAYNLKFSCQNQYGTHCACVYNVPWWCE